MGEPALDNLVSLSADSRDRLARIVVIDHPSGTDVYGTDSFGEPVSSRFSSPGSLPWDAVLRAALQPAGISVGVAVVEDAEPGTGFRRLRFTARAV